MKKSRGARTIFLPIRKPAMLFLQISLVLITLNFSVAVYFCFQIRGNQSPRALRNSSCYKIPI